MNETPTLLYIGEKEIESVNGNTVEFKDGTKKDYTVLAQSYLISETPRNDSDLQEIATTKVAVDLISVIEQHDLPLFDTNLAFQKAHQSIMDAQDNAFADTLGIPKVGTARQRLMEVRLSEVNAARK